jgi:hypothetical protein
MPASLVSITDHQPREQDTVSYWRRRARKAENLLRELLSFSEDLTDEQRAHVLGTLYGNTGQRRRNDGGLSDHEQRIVDQYRAMDADDRQLHRLLFARLAGNGA